MVAAVAAGLVAWAADALFYKHWADVLRGKEGSSSDRRERMKKRRQKLIVVLATCFFGGVLAAGAFGVLRVLHRPNRAMQRTASKPATDASGVCHPHFGCVVRFSGLAVADLVSR
ncbi:MAG TPA: hypothetical protein VNP98_16885 [Chthoniobacterales bacterium]|nr:hypothetical protein [Chthoniobacterales bacterium]